MSTKEVNNVLYESEIDKNADVKSKIRIFHDAFLQYGGAEKVALSWQKLTNRPIVSLAVTKNYSWKLPNETLVLAPWIKSQSQLEKIYPLMPVLKPSLSKNLQNDEIRLVSSTGLAHLIGGEWEKRVVYVHSPTRWIWNKKSFDIGRPISEKIAATVLRPFFKLYDRSNIGRADILIANSRVTQELIWKAFKQESEIIYPVVELNDGVPQKPAKIHEDEDFLLAIGRDRGYKGLGELVLACQKAKRKLVVVGSGTERLSGSDVIGLGFVTDSEINWLYEKAQALLAFSQEDFGLTPVEAALHGCPTIALNQFGYKESVSDGVSGFLVDPNSKAEQVDLLRNIRRDSINSKSAIIFGENFSPHKHFNQILRMVS
jgi:glycosyltransferase involved in cell wall biosynthesis